MDGRGFYGEEEGVSTQEAVVNCVAIIGLSVCVCLFLWYEYRREERRK